MKISGILNPESIRIQLKNTSKEGVISELLDLIPIPAENVEQKSEYLTALMEREELFSTGVGEGVAIPHAKVDLPGKIFISLGMSSQGVDFNSIDNKPVRILFLMLAGIDADKLHLKVLARISRLMNRQEIRDNLMDCTTTADVLDLLNKLEKRHIVE